MTRKVKRPLVHPGDVEPVVDLGGVGIVINRLQAEAADLTRAHTAQIEGIKLKAQGIITMLEEGRRGDALKALRELASKPEKLKVRPRMPDDPAAA